MDEGALTGWSLVTETTDWDTNEHGGSAEVCRGEASGLGGVVIDGWFGDAPQTEQPNEGGIERG